MCPDEEIGQYATRNAGTALSSPGRIAGKCVAGAAPDAFVKVPFDFDLSFKEEIVEEFFSSATRAK